MGGGGIIILSCVGDLKRRKEKRRKFEKTKA
jgi:hypothetical protein